MFLLLNAFTSSLDGIVFGLSLKMSNIKLSKFKILLIFVFNLLIDFTILRIFKYLNLNIFNKYFFCLVYLILALLSLKKEGKKKFKNNLYLLIIILTHSLDGSIVSLNFLSTYNILYISFIFSSFALIMLLLGFYLKPFKHNYSFILFLILAFLNYFF